MVARSVSKNEYLKNPSAKQAMDLEWKKLRDKGCWDESQVKELSHVKRDAAANKAEIHIGEILELCMEKGQRIRDRRSGEKVQGKSRIPRRPNSRRPR